MPRKKLKRPSVDDVDSQVASLTDVTMVDKLSEYDLLKVFSFLSFHDKGTAAQVCRHWKSIIYQKSLWKASAETRYIPETADMKIMAPSLVKRGITEVSVSDADSVTNGKRNSCSVLFRNQQLCHVTRIMAASLTVLDLYGVARRVRHENVSNIFNVSMPNLEYLTLGQDFELSMAAIKDICLSCSNLSKLVILDCSDITQEGLMHLTNLNLASLTLGSSQNLTDPVLQSMSTKLPELRVLALPHTMNKITVDGVAHIANLKNLRVLDLEGCEGISVNCIGKLCVAGRCSYLESLWVNVCADAAMAKIGRSELVIKHLMVGGCGCCQATDAGIDGLLEHGHKHYRNLEIVGKCDISSNGMVKLGTKLNDLYSFKLDGVEKIGDVRDAVKRERERGNTKS